MAVVIKLAEAVTSISNKVNTINNHIDNVINDAPTKLHVYVSAFDADWKKIGTTFCQASRVDLV